MCSICMNLMLAAAQVVKEAGGQIHGEENETNNHHLKTSGLKTLNNPVYCGQTLEGERIYHFPSLGRQMLSTTPVLQDSEQPTSGDETTVSRLFQDST